MLFYFDPLLVLKPLSPICLESKKDKGKEKIVEGGFASKPLGNSLNVDVPLVLFLKLLILLLFLRSTAHLEQVDSMSWSSDFKIALATICLFLIIYYYISLFHNFVIIN
jgi:hypothetical protein